MSAKASLIRDNSVSHESYIDKVRLLLLNSKEQRGEKRFALGRMLEAVGMVQRCNLMRIG